MSTWYEPKKEDMEIDGEDLNVFVHNDDFGTVYAAIKIKDLKEILTTPNEK